MVLPAGVRLSGPISLGVIARAFPAERMRQVLDKILEERAASGLGRQVLRGIKRKMSSYPLRPRAPHPTTRVDFIAAIRVAK